MYRDEIIEEVWRNRDEYAAEHNHDLAEILSDLQQRQKQNPFGTLVDRRPNKPILQTPDR